MLRMNKVFLSLQQSPTNSPHHVPSNATARPVANGGATSSYPNGGLSNSTSINSEVIFRDGTGNGSTAGTNSLSEADDEPIAPIRPPIHSKTKNWYSGFCNRWASLMGVSMA